MGREPIPTWFFAVVIARLGHRYLLVHERKHGQLWYLPAGRVEPGETLAEAAVRETREEAGITVVPAGVFRVEHTPGPGGVRVRVIYLAYPVDDTKPKSVADGDSLGAGWFDLDEIRELPLRGPEVLEMLRAIEAGAPVYPLSLIQQEGRPLGP